MHPLDPDDRELLDDHERRLAEERPSGPSARTYGEPIDRYTGAVTLYGSLKDGKREGAWAIEYDDGSLVEGRYVLGERHGHWIEKYPDGSVHAGAYTGGERDGLWSFTSPDGTVERVRYVEGWRDDFDPSSPSLDEAARRHAELDEQEVRTHRTQLPVDWAVPEGPDSPLVRGDDGLLRLRSRPAPPPPSSPERPYASALRRTLRAGANSEPGEARETQRGGMER